MVNQNSMEISKTTPIHNTEQVNAKKSLNLKENVSIATNKDVDLHNAKLRSRTQQIKL